MTKKRFIKLVMNLKGMDRNIATDIAYFASGIVEYKEMWDRLNKDEGLFRDYN